MSALYLVPNAYLRQWKAEAASEKKSFFVMSIPGLAARILKEGLVPYREDAVLKEIAVWQGVQEAGGALEFFAPISHFPGFIQELKWLFQRMDLGEEVLQNVPYRGKIEFKVLHETYHRILGEHGILDGPGQLREALKVTAARTFLPNVKRICLKGLGELTPLEEKFVHSFAAGRPLQTIWSEAINPKAEVFKAADPYQEVEMIGKAVREQVEGGVSLNKIGLVFPQPSQYLPILCAVFADLNLPWRTPAASLRNSPLGKAVLALIEGEAEGWGKHHLELLTAPGWGLPFRLSVEERRRLRLSPPLRELPAWREYLGGQDGWERILGFLTKSGEHLAQHQPLENYGIWLENILDEFKPEKWVLAEQNLEDWAELAKAWDGMLSIARSLQQYRWACTGKQFLELFRILLDTRRLRPRRVFTQQLQVLEIEQLGAYTYDVLFAGGLVEGQFPPRRYAHWLTKTVSGTERGLHFQRLIKAAPQVYLYYPETDQEGKLNLPSTLLPKRDKEKDAVPPTKVHYPSLSLGSGILQDEKLLLELKKRILGTGLSVSQLNDYVSCPYKFFCSNVLGLKPYEEESLDIDPREHGTILHDVLEKFWRSHLEGSLPALEEAQVRIEGLLRKEYEKRGEKPPVSVVRTMRKFVRRDLEWVVKGGFRPKYLEKQFQGLSVQTEAGPLEIRGRIDRIDVNSEGKYILYDYKSGSAPTGAEIRRGEDIQITAYLLAAEDILPEGENVGAAYFAIKEIKRAGIFRAAAQKDLCLPSKTNCFDEQEFSEQMAFLKQTMVGFLDSIFAGRFPIEPRNERICTYCPFRSICRKEVRGA